MRKIFIGHVPIEDPNYQCVNSLDALYEVVDDGECDVIVVAGFLRAVHYGLLVDVIRAIAQKVKLGGILKIVDLDFDLLSRTYIKKGDIAKLNNVVMNYPMYSLLNDETIISCVQENTDLILTGHQLGELEFDMEFRRNG